MRSRPLAVSVAAVVLVSLSLLNLVPLSMEGMPAGFVCLGVMLGIAGLVAAAGSWMLKRWGVWLAIVVCAINLVFEAPGGYPSCRTPHRESLPR